MNRDYQKIAEITLKSLSNTSWADISLDEIKKKSRVKSFKTLVKSKKDLLIKINNYFDHKLFLMSSKIEKSSDKDMIFEIIMMRFDILQQHRKGMVSIFKSFKKKPSQLFFLIPELLESIIMMIQYTNISTKGKIGQLKIKGVFLIYVSSFLIWLKDDSASLDKTMIALDNYLNQANKILKFVS